MRRARIAAVLFALGLALALVFGARATDSSWSSSLRERAATPTPARGR